MAHDTVYGFCENKCKVEVSPKSDTEPLVKVFTVNEDGDITINGNVTSDKLINADGGIKGVLAGSVEGFLFVKGTVETAGDVVYATSAAQTPSAVSSGSVTVNSYVVSFPDVYEIVPGVAYCRKSDVDETTMPTKTVTIYNKQPQGYAIKFTYSSPSTSSTTITVSRNSSTTVQWKAGEKYSYRCTYGVTNVAADSDDYSISIAAKSVYVKFARP